MRAVKPAASSNDNRLRTPAMREHDGTLTSATGLAVARSRSPASSAYTTH